MEMLYFAAVWLTVFVLSATVHEAAHALVAWKLGDETAYAGGQVTLNPIPHMRREPVGMLVVPLVTVLLYQGAWCIGWASAPYDPFWAARHPRRAAWMALAGPASNLLLMLLAGIALRIGITSGAFVPPPAEMLSFTRVVMGTGGMSGGVATLLSVAFSLNLILFVFNLLPVPPLDGAGALPLLMRSEEKAVRWLELSRSPQFAMAGLLVAWVMMSSVFIHVFVVALNVLYAGIVAYR